MNLNNILYLCTAIWNKTGKVCIQRNNRQRQRNVSLRNGKAKDMRKATRRYSGRYFFENFFREGRQNIFYRS